MELNELRLDIARSQKRGLHFILAAIFIWTLILVSQLLDLSLLQQNMFIFCGSAVLIPFALLASKILHVDFQGKGNPLSKLGLLFSLNQLVYILIAMWAFAESPEHMLMIYVIIFGAHFMPYSWLYRSPAYLVMSIAVPVAALVIGLLLPRYFLALLALVALLALAFFLHRECKKQ